MALANVVPFEDGAQFAGMVLTAGFACDADLLCHAPSANAQAGEWADTETRYAAVDDLDEEEDEDDEDDDLDDEDLEDEDDEDLDDEDDDLEDEDDDYDDDDEEEDEDEDEE